MAKIEAYKFINPGMAADNASEGSLVGRKLVLSFNRFGKTLNGVGSVVKDIESIEIARIKNDALREKMERRQAQRDRDSDAEEDQERAKLGKTDKGKPSKGKIKGFFGKSKIGKGLMSMLPMWAKMMEPLFMLFTEILKIAVVKEMLEWFADPDNEHKIEEFFYKSNVIFTKLKEFGQWLVNDKLISGWQKLVGKESTLMERFSGLWDLTQGIAVISMLTNPIGSLAMIVTWIGNFCNVFNRKPPKPPKGDTNKTKNSKLNQRTKSNASSKGVKGKTSFTNTGKLRSTKFRAPSIQGASNIMKKGNFWQKTWSGIKNWGKKGVKNFKAKPLVTSGNILKSGAKGATNLGVGILADWGINWAADKFIFEPINKKATEMGNQKIDEAIAQHGEAKVLNKLKSDLAAEQAKTPWNKWANMALLGYPNVLVGPNETKIDVLSQKIDYINNRDTTPKKTIEVKKSDSNKKKTNFFGNLFSGWGKKKKDDVVAPVQKTAKKEVTSSKKWWEFWKGDGGKLPEFFFGKIFKGISKAVGSVVKGVGSVVSGVVNTVGKVVSNPIVSTALSFVPGVGPIVAGINAFNSLRQGDIMGAVMGGVGALGNFAAIGSTAKSMVNTPNWMMNLRMSKFGQGLAGMYNSGANAWAGLTAGVSNFMGSNIGQLAQGVYQGATGGGWGSALSAGSNILGLNKPGGLFGEGGFFGEGGRMANMGNWLQEHNLAGIGNMFPGLAGLANSIPGFSQLPGIQDIFAGGFSPMQAIGGLAEKNGMGGLYKSAMGLLGGGDMYTGLKEIAGEIGVSPEALGAVEKGKSLYDRAKTVALQKDPVELLPIVMPIIQDQVVISPQIKEKAVIVRNAYNSLAGRM